MSDHLLWAALGLTGTALTVVAWRAWAVRVRATAVERELPAEFRVDKMA